MIKESHKTARPRILAPAGDFISLKAALDSGADEIYFGVKGFNMRAGAHNFAPDDMPRIAKECHKRKVAAYLALNIIVYEEEIKNVDELLRKAKSSGIDAVICWDMSVVAACMKNGIDIHLSTQASVSNYESLKQYKRCIPKLKRVVLARECSLEQVRSIIGKIRKDRLDVEIEAFAHGAMCVSISGRCFMSQELFCKSANRGECLQPCRRNYEVYLKDPEEGKVLLMGKDYVMSPKDLCTIGFIDKLVDAGIASFKIEGRNRSPEYVKTVVEAYKQAITYYATHKDEINADALEREKFETLKKELAANLGKVYNRGFSAGFYMGRPMNEWHKAYGSSASKTKEYIGKVLNYYPKIGVAEIKIESFGLESEDNIMFQGSTTGIVEQKAGVMHADSKGKTVALEKAAKGCIITLKTERKVRENDKLYRIRDAARK